MRYSVRWHSSLFTINPSRANTHNVHVAFKRLDEGPNHPLWSINANVSNYKTQPNLS